MKFGLVVSCEKWPPGFYTSNPQIVAASQGLRFFSLKWIYHRVKVTRIFWHTFYIRFMLWRIEKKKQAFARAEQSTVTISGISGDGLAFYCCQWLSMKRFQVFLLEMNLGTKGFTTRISSLPWNSKEITNGIRNQQSCINQQNGRGRNIWTSTFCVGVVVFIHDFHFIPGQKLNTRKVKHVETYRHLCKRSACWKKKPCLKTNMFLRI